MPLNMEQEKSAGAIIFRQGKERLYLLLEYGAGGHWDFVKGHIEPGESELETVRREAKEEASLGKLVFIPNFKEQMKYFYRKDGNLIPKTVVFYLAEAGQEEIKLSFEHTGYKWMNYGDAMQQLTFKNAKEILKKAEEFLKGYSRQKKLSSF